MVREFAALFGTNLFFPRNAGGPHVKMRLIGRIFDVICHHQQQIQKNYTNYYELKTVFHEKLRESYSWNFSQFSPDPCSLRADITVVVVVGAGVGAGVGGARLELSPAIICSLFWLSRVRGLPTNPIEGCQEFISDQSEPLLADHCTSLVHGEMENVSPHFGNKSFQQSYQHANYFNSICLHPGGTELHVMFGVRKREEGWTCCRRGIMLILFKCELKW